MKVRSIRSKVLIAITGITLLTAAAMAFVFYGRSSRMIEENYITVLSQRTRLLTDTVDDMLKNVCNIDIKASCDKEIKEELEQQGVKCFEDSPEWTISRIRSILQNEKYCGDVLMQKTFRQDFINRKAIKNTPMT